MLWRMPADSHATRIGIMSAFQRTDRRQHAGIAGRSLSPPYSGAKVLSARSQGGVAETSHTSQASERRVRSVDRAGALVAVGPAHVGRQGEGDLAVVMARRRAKLEGLQALAAQFDVVHGLHALIAAFDDAAGEGIGRPALAQPDVLRAQRHARLVAGAERLRRPAVDAARAAEAAVRPLPPPH